MGASLKLGYDWDLASTSAFLISKGGYNGTCLEYTWDIKPEFGIQTISGRHSNLGENDGKKPRVLVGHSWQLVYILGKKKI